MPNLNILILAGHLTREPEFKCATSGALICRGTVAVNNGYGEKKQAAFVDFTCFNAQATFLQKYAKKGMALCLEGYIQQETWEKDGVKKSKLSMIANKVSVFSQKQDNDEQGNVGNCQDSKATCQQNNATHTNTSSANQNINVSPEEPPF
jgi:single-strand DNA-binding protein